MREAYRWFAASATQGNKDAMFMVGHMLQTGEGVTPKPEMAEIYLHLACQRRQKDACASLAREQGK